jgi:hypothetical protein
MGNWHDFFVAELGASAGFAGLLFVSMSVSHARILQYGGLPERGLQALTSLFLVFVIATLTLAPHQSPRLLGVEILCAARLQTILQTRLQILGYRLTDKPIDDRYSISLCSPSAAQRCLPLAQS